MQFDAAFPCAFGPCAYTGHLTLACVVCNKHVVDPAHFILGAHTRYAPAAAAQPLSADTTRYFNDTLARNWPGAAVANVRCVSEADAITFLATGVMPPPAPTLPPPPPTTIVLTVVGKESLAGHAYDGSPDVNHEPCFLVMT